MGSITEEQIVKAQTSHPGATLHLLSNADTGVDIIVKSPSEGEWKRFRTMQNDEGQRTLALRTLVLGCVVEPSIAEFTKVLGELPGLAETFGAELVEIAGVSRATTRRKL